MFYFFKPTFPVTKKTFIKSTLGFVAIVLRKKLLEKKVDGECFLEGEYIIEARRILNEELDHIIKRLEEANFNHKEAPNGRDTIS
jgi:hypothetical protein